MEHIGNIMDATLGGILLLAITAIGTFLLKATKRTGVARTLIRFIWSGVLLAMCAFCAFAAYITQHGRGFNNGAMFVMYLISVLTYGVTFALFNSNWISSYADKVSTTWKHFRDLASPDYTPKATPQRDLPPVAQMIAQLEEVDYRSEGLFKVTKQLNQVGAEAVEPLIVALSHARANVRRNAAYALGEIKDNRAIKPLIEAFNDTDMVLVAAMALAEFGRPAIEPLAEATRDTNTRVRDGAIMALGWCKDVRSVEELDKIFSGWLDERRSGGEKLIGTSQKLLEEYWLPPTGNMTPEEREGLLAKRRKALSELREQSNDYHTHQQWWLGRNVAQALSSIARNAIKYPSK